jgi:MFS family permease
MAVRGFLCQNVSIGCAFGGFGIAVLPMEAHFGVSRGLLTLGLTLVVLAMGVASPLAAVLMARIGLRRTMLIGVVLSAFGYVALAFAPSIWVVLAAYGLLVGVGGALFGPFPSSVLASNWFEPSPGRALGFVNMPLLAALVPLFGASLIEQHGFVMFNLVLAGLHVLLVPAVLGIVDRPPGAVADAGPSAAAPEPAAAISTALLLRQPLFWVVVLGAGLLNAIAITGAANLFALVRELGGSPAEAGLALALMGGAAMIGSLLAGFVCDRIGAARALALTAAGIAISWLVLYFTGAIALALAAALLIGICSAAVFPAVNVLAGHLYGAVSLPRAIGLFSVLTLPLTFGLPPLGGVLRVAAGNYAPVAATIVWLAAAVAVLFYVAGHIAERRLAQRGAENAIA